MANNRMRLRCQCGGESKWFAKAMGHGWYVAPVFEANLVEVLNAFFDEHEDCYVESDNPLAIQATYTLEYEQVATPAPSLPEG